MLKEKTRICPKCKENGREGHLISTKTKKGSNRNRIILSCSNYPTCEYETRDRKADFKYVSNRRLEKAVKTIQDLGNLSNINYVYSEKEVLEIFSKLNFEVKDNLSKFGKGFSDRKHKPLSPKERFDRLLDMDRYQFEELRKSDPEVADYALKNLHKVSNPFEQLQDKQEPLDSSKSEILEKISFTSNQLELLRKQVFQKLDVIHQELENLKKS